MGDPIKGHCGPPPLVKGSLHNSVKSGQLAKKGLGCGNSYFSGHTFLVGLSPNYLQRKIIQHLKMHKIWAHQVGQK